MKKLLLTVLLILFAISLLLSAFLTFSSRAPMPPEGTQSYELLQPGPFDVATETIQLVDPTRFIPNPDAPGGRSERSMPVRLWYPSSDEHSPQPLVIYSHGFMSTGEGVTSLAGPTEVFTRKFFNTRSIPFMAIAATEEPPAARTRWCTYLEQTFEEENKEISIQGQ